ncbi:hypothetical protein L3N51_02051 [Metallosphaera sp. J1]|uniref:hypothetical protein n=1 Tax=Metallosphaera javensis (ex Hofmann et al. 2022) TaxID=99938 RepID=UPI001EDD45AE|nr:hypothetical protein [Metallosphaera javensis (ex Hofmann et al. 2022)]MCG3109755.1 hypothetical protein [Metallosphaera javensis (ex Hofmann et al. 2022)]
MKSGTRVAILVRGEPNVVCVFQGEHLEHLFLSLQQLEGSRVKEEINLSNFGVGKEYRGQLEEECSRIATLISKELKKMM